LLLNCDNPVSVSMKHALLIRNACVFVAEGTCLTSRCLANGQMRHNIIYSFMCNSNIYIIHTRSLTVSLWHSISCPSLCSSYYNGCLVTWTVARLTVAKFKPLIFLVWGFAFYDVAKIWIFMILYDLCLLLYTMTSFNKCGKYSGYHICLSPCLVFGTIEGIVVKFCTEGGSCELYTKILCANLCLSLIGSQLLYMNSRLNSTHSPPPKKRGG
jgi:hypothetical protein